MLGGYLSIYLQERGLAIASPPRFDAAGATSADIESIIAPLHPRAVINCIGAIRQRDVDDAQMRAVNAEFPHRLAKVCAGENVPLIQLSTDCVFAGTRGNYLERDTPDAQDAYGRSKAAGEPASAMVVRTSFVGSERHNKRSLLEWVRSNAGKEVDGYANQKWNGVTCLQLAKLLEEVVREGAYRQGVQHYFSPRAVSKYELVSLISEIYGFDVRVRKTDAKETRDLTLASEHPLPQPPDIREQLIEMAAFDKAHGLL